jgi:hypothetical protein
MKTMKNIFVLALVLIFSASVGFARQTGPQKQSKVFSHEVKYFVRLSAMTDLGNGQYLVDLIDQNGQEIVDPQPVVPGVDIYVFSIDPAMVGNCSVKVTPYGSGSTYIGPSAGKPVIRPNTNDIPWHSQIINRLIKYSKYIGGDNIKD